MSCEGLLSQQQQQKKTVMAATERETRLCDEAPSSGTTQRCKYLNTMVLTALARVEDTINSLYEKSIALDD